MTPGLSSTCSSVGLLPFVWPDGRSNQLRIPDGGDHRAFHRIVGKQFLGKSVGLLSIERIAFDQKTAGRPNRQIRAYPRFSRQ